MKQTVFNLAYFRPQREALVELVKQKYPGKKGTILLFANFEQEALKFKQESSFYYFSGINEPGTVIAIELDGPSTLFTPNCGPARIHWVANCIDPQCDPKDIGFDSIKYLGQQVHGYEFNPFFLKSEYKNLLSYIEQLIKNDEIIFTLNPDTQKHYFEQRFILDRINNFLPDFLKSVIDISPIVAGIRRTKNKTEIENLYKAIDITIMGHEAAAQIIAPGKFENEVQAGIEFVFTSSAASLAFPSIVGSGKNSTVLHYTANNKKISKEDLVVVDIGAEYNHYCGDLTRTYPASGKFTKRQKEIYNIVLEAQEYIENIARPGLWLSNKEHPDLSLNHLSREFIKEKGYDKYFLHGIGHFLGLDVHDVGDYSEPLKPGDVITIEPGIYIADESIGVRIEDNYWIVEDGVVCLSESLPKSPEDIEELILNNKNK